jgi:molybdopterin-guanine dinucleotide biosynthesis adapter protein
MKAIAISGNSRSGKTTLCEIIIKGLRDRGYSVGSVKEIHGGEFKLDPVERTNTNRHRSAGSELVVARGDNETGVFYQGKLPISKILSFFDYDFIILEGVNDCNCARILTAHTEDELDRRMDERVIAISGVIANSGVKEIKNLPVINVLEAPEELIQFVLEHAFEPLNNFHCGKCGHHDCRELAGLIAQGKAKRSDCAIYESNVELLLDGKPLPMVPFVQDIIKGAVLGMAKELRGFENNKEIVLRIKE